MQLELWELGTVFEDDWLVLEWLMDGGPEEGLLVVCGGRPELCGDEEVEKGLLDFDSGGE
jgi:hypothetical protein